MNDMQAVSGEGQNDEYYLFIVLDSVGEVNNYF